MTNTFRSTCAGSRCRFPGIYLLTVVMWIILSPLILNAQQKKNYSGVVKDKDGMPLVGVTVMVKNEKTGATTDVNGRFTIAAKPGNTLVFTYIGFSKLEQVVDARTEYNIRLADQAGTLNDVVVVGYATQKRKDLTGAVGSVNMKEFEKAPVKSFDEALAGRVAGVAVASNDGQPGSIANIVIRGAGSITQDNSPLYVIDGFPTESSNANAISPADIESIDVLKDASATAIYGARGSNGVILITTKKGKTGVPQVSYNGYYGWQQIPNKIPLMGAYDFVKYVGEVNPGIYDSVYLAGGVKLEDYRNRESIDMQDYIYRVGQNTNHDLAVRGGNDKTKYSLSGNFNNQKGIIINSGFKRYQGRFSLDQTVNDKLKVGVNANYAYSEAFGIPVSATNFYASATTLYSVWGFRPTTSIKGRDSAANLIDDFYDPGNELANNQDYRVNPLQNIQNQYTMTKAGNLMANAYVQYAITKDLSLRIAGGINSVTTEADIFNNSKTQSGSKWNSNGVNGSVEFRPTSVWNSQNSLTYHKTFNKQHNLTVLAVVEAQGNKTSQRKFSANQVPNEDLGMDALDLAAPANTSLISLSSRWTMASGALRVNYDYASKYLFSASIRADGSSKFAAGNKWGYFPSASAAWRFSAEEFMKSAGFISDGKIRLGYGASGNNRVGDFSYLPQLSLTNNQYWYSVGNGPLGIGAVMTSSGNPNLRWETNEQANIGLDMAFLKNRLTLTVDAYKRTTTDLLLNAALPYAHGIESASGFKNVGKLENKGLEITVGATVVDNKAFTWNSNFNISFNRNKILSLAEGQQSILYGSGTFFNTTYSGLFPYISVVGRPLGEMYGLVFDGVYQYGDFDLMPNGTYLLKGDVPTNGSARNAIRPGDIKYKDLNGDNQVNNQDYTIIGSGLPKHTGGFSNDFRYRNFDLNILLQWSYGNDNINANRYVFEGGIVNNPNLNQFATYANRWTPDNPSNTMFRAGGMGNAAYSSRVIEDGSYLKLRTVSLGYSLPAAVLKRAKIKSLRVYGAAQNIYTWTKYSGMDPEVNARPNNLSPGFDYAAYPHSLSYVTGLNVTF
ncbi:TonB-linked outer membrane protein, SusC/RagA family [Chitinophaga jiangningensis]|uniref:TonB-linked outer membrane protein, SusC/RagA family n=2 Tax=Chitinophaga jiangningensis TaxID=1419482 RepID=A0A1M7A9U9_9BACT|nr:TonB-linked outer membrane protein, SusC/RagA family [Chitinophaga jiangningensis]